MTFRYRVRIRGGKHGNSYPPGIQEKITMGALEIILGAVLLVIALFLIVAILLQESKKGGLSGTITGSGAETFYGKAKGKSSSKFLRTATMVAAIVFAVLVLVAYLFSGIGR